jgi:dGTP triphosphohydrolase
MNEEQKKSAVENTTEQANSSTNLKQAQEKVKNWYDNEFLPYKKQKQQEKQDFEDFAKIIAKNPKEIKFMLANIFDADYASVVKTWNALSLEPKITDIKLEGENLIITDTNSKKSVINFDELLSSISKILGA